MKASFGKFEYSIAAEASQTVVCFRRKLGEWRNVLIEWNIYKLRKGFEVIMLYTSMYKFKIILNMLNKYRFTNVVYTGRLGSFGYYAVAKIEQWTSQFQSASIYQTTVHWHVTNEMCELSKSYFIYTRLKLLSKMSIKIILK